MTFLAPEYFANVSHQGNLPSPLVSSLSVFFSPITSQSDTPLGIFKSCQSSRLLKCTHRYLSVQDVSYKTVQTKYCRSKYCVRFKAMELFRLHEEDSCHGHLMQLEVVVSQIIHNMS